jgi:hypothetical protein
VSYFDLDIMDVYILPELQNVILVDFNPFHPVTDSKLFDWNELENMSLTDDLPLFRCIEHSQDIRPSPNYMQTYPEDLLQFHQYAKESTIKELLDHALQREHSNLVKDEKDNIL